MCKHPTSPTFLVLALCIRTERQTSHPLRNRLFLGHGALGVVQHVPQPLLHRRDPISGLFGRQLPLCLAGSNLLEHLCDQLGLVSQTPRRVAGPVEILQPLTAARHHASGTSIRLGRSIHPALREPAAEGQGPRLLIPMGLDARPTQSN